jgi:hypothetical protein
VDPDDPAVANRVVVGGGNADEVEELAGPGALLVHGNRHVVASEGVSRGVGAATGDGCQKGLSCQRLIDAAR